MLSLLFSMALAAPSTSLEEKLYHELSVKDAFPGCATLTPLGSPEEVRDGLLQLTEKQMPAWVPMRAADCLVELNGQDTAVTTRFESWAKDPERAGLALVVVQRIDLLPKPVALRIVDASIERSQNDRRFARRLVRALDNSLDAELRGKADLVR